MAIAKTKTLQQTQFGECDECHVPIIGHRKHMTTCSAKCRQRRSRRLRMDEAMKKLALKRKRLMPVKKAKQVKKKTRKKV